MTVPASDAAGRETAGDDPRLRAESPGLGERIVERIRHRWWFIPAAIAVCLAMAGAYLAFATKLYTVTAVVMAERTRPPMATDLPPDEYLTLQRGVLLSPAVRGDQDLTIRTDKGEGTIGKLVNDPKLYQNLLETTDQLSVSAKDLRRLFEQWEQEGVSLKLK